MAPTLEISRPWEVVPNDDQENGHLSAATGHFCMAGFLVQSVQRRPGTSYF